MAKRRKQRKLSDYTPTLTVAGWAIAWKKKEDATWTIEDEQGVPAMYSQQEEARDREAFLISKGFDARAMAVLANGSEANTKGDNHG